MPDVTRRHFNSKAFDQKRFVAAVRQMRTMPAPGFPNLYDKYIQWHMDAGFNAVAHFGLAFLAWHRALLWEFEKDLQAADVALGKDGKIGIPWWDWINDTSADETDARGKMWNKDFMGPTGRGANEEVIEGPFVRANWPPGPLLPLPEPQFLRRGLGVRSTLANAADIKSVVGLRSYDESPFNTSAPNTSFRNVLEGHETRAGGVSNLHNSAHGWIGGNMNNVLTSPYEPAFWLNHANVDRIWATWQTVHPRLATQYPTDAEIDAVYAPPPPPRPGSIVKLDESLLPWNGLGGLRKWTPRMVLNWQGMGPAGEHQYRYSTDPPGSFSFS